MSKILTISIAAYNVEDSIDDTLKSLIVDEETMSKMEVIIVDDGSKDNTALKANEYVKSYPDTFKVISKENGGYGSTINTSVLEAKGRYFKQLDGGDKYVSDNLKDFVDYLSNTDSDIVVCPHIKRYLLDNKDEIEDAYQEYASKGTMNISDVSLDKRLWMHGIAFKTEVWNKLGREIPTHCFYTDMEYVLYPFVHAKTISFYDKAIYLYFLQCEGQSVSLEGIKKHFDDSIRMMWDLCDLYNDLLTKDLDEGKDRIFEMSVNHAISFVYTSFLSLNEKDIKELKELDEKIKEKYPDIYQKSMKVKRLLLMRKTGFKMRKMYQKMI